MAVQTSTPEPTKTQLREVMSLYKDERPRGKILILGASLDEALKQLLEVYLVPAAGTSDELLGQYYPLGEFKARIIASERLGLISSLLARDLNHIRALRNACAHELKDFSFEAGAVRDKTNLLYAHLADSIKEEFHPGDSATTEEKFEIAASFIFLHIENLIKTTRTLHPPKTEAILYASPGGTDKATVSNGAKTSTGSSTKGKS